MKPKSVFNILETLSDFQFKMLFTNEDEDLCSSTSVSASKRCNRNLDDFQIFTDHLKLNERFKKTLYYGKLPPTECPSLPLSEVTLELFTKTVPNEGLDVLDMHYAASVSRKACISPCSMILAIMYLDQLRHKNPEYLQNITSCDLFLISMLVASKFLYDNGEDDEVFNGEWACCANIDVKDLNNLEREFLAALDWEVFARPSEFSKLLHDIECKVALKEMTKRGWFSYTDLAVLLHSSVPIGIITVLVDNVIKVIVITAVAYAAAVLTMFGANEVCKNSIPSVQNFQILVNDTGGAVSMEPVNQTSSDKMMASTLFTDEISTDENLDNWLEKVLSLHGQNETVPLVSYSLHRISAFHAESKTCPDLLHCEDELKMRPKLPASVNETFHQPFLASARVTNGNCYVIHTKSSFHSAVPFHSSCFCSVELDMWLSSIYRIGYPMGICQKYISKTLKE